ncbi:MAG: hypothetical protein M3094_03775 [Actinomycetia bacterium]|nr:hypothetical protein [Actinomycetes bacterium]
MSTINDTHNNTWRTTLSRMSMGTPITRGGLSIFPVFSNSVGGRPVRSGVDAIADGSVVLKERNGGEVPALVAISESTVPVLFPQGDTVVGGRQDRTLNVSVLLDVGESVIPVSCVEAGRWHEDGSFSHGGALAPRRVRRVASDSVAARAHGDLGRQSDQGAVWSAIDVELHRTGTRSESRAVRDLHRDDNVAVRELIELGPLPGQIGVVVARGQRILGAELFSTPELLKSYWSSVIGSYTVDIGRSFRSYPSATRALRFLDRISRSEGVDTRGVGLGEERHVRTDRVVAHALSWEGELIHLAGFAR